MQFLKINFWGLGGQVKLTLAKPGNIIFVKEFCLLIQKGMMLLS